MKAVLSSGNSMPMAIFGTSHIPKADTKQAVLTALQNGFMHLDCAPIYGNEVEVGEALSEAFAANIITRDSLFINSKAWPSNYRRIRESCLESMRCLQLSYIDLYLLHWPLALQQQVTEPPLTSKEYLIIDRFPLHLVWAQMEALVEEGLVRSIGVSNWTIALLNDMLAFSKIPPTVNEIEINPYNKKKELVEYCKQNNIVPIAYRVIFNPKSSVRSLLRKCVLEDQKILEIAGKYGKSPAQVVLSWCLKRGCAFVVRSANPERVRENANSHEVVVEDEDLNKIDSMPDEGCYVNAVSSVGIHIFA